MGSNLKELAKNALIETIKSNINEYFDFETHQTDVADYFFKYNGSKTENTCFDWDVNGIYTINATWERSELTSDLDFKLYNVQIELTDYGGSNIKTHVFEYNII